MAFGIGYFWWAAAFAGIIWLGKPFIAALCLFALITCLLHVTGIGPWLDGKR